MGGGGEAVSDRATKVTSYGVLEIKVGYRFRTMISHADKNYSGWTPLVRLSPGTYHVSNILEMTFAFL